LLPRTSVSTKISFHKLFLDDEGSLSIDNKAGEKQWANTIETNQRWVVDLKKGFRRMKTFLEEGDAQLCLQGRQCVSLGIEIAQLRDTIARM
jgi:hypothetical protein